MKSCNMSEASSEVLELIERIDRTRALLAAVAGAATAIPESAELRAATVSVEAELARLEDALEHKQVVTGVVAATACRITAPARRGGSVCGR